MRDQIGNYIAAEILRDQGRRIRTDEPLISSGLIDSFSLVDLALYVEGAFGVRIEDWELSASVFDSVDELANLISGRLQEQAA